MPPHIVLKKVVQKITTKLIEKTKRARDLNTNTHISFNVPLIQNKYIDLKHLDISNIDQKTAIYLSDMYCEHRFDLLGSGWVKNSYNSEALGVEGYQYSMNVPAPISVNIGYEPIDWQKDYKSGYRWSEKTWYKDISYGMPGVDIKVPWELARLQHLPQLAIFSLVDESLKEQNLKEFQCQILDFITNNPPRMGVNWVCTMDVAIRAANMLIAYDLFCQLDTSDALDTHFKQTFANSIYEHGLHIVNNFEYTDWLTSNHYLSNIAGLVFIAGYLDSNPEIDQWLAFGVQELINETEKQFYEDGGNFESSTCYHRLSGEMVLYATAFLLGLPSQKTNSLKQYNAFGWKVIPRLKSLQHQQYTIGETIVFPQWYIDRLYKIGRFTADITKPDEEIPQFGDNDSGRFFRFTPTGSFITNAQAVERYLNLNNYPDTQDLFWDENSLNHSTLLNGFSGLFDNNVFKPFQGFEKSFIHALAGRKLNVTDDSYMECIVSSNIPLECKYTQFLEYHSESELHDIQSYHYPQSGIYIFKNDLFYLAVCTTPLGQNGNGGHTHNDKLGFELYLNRKSIVRDPGTYLYTPLPEKRNEFRSIYAHNVPVADEKEQNSWNGFGLFALKNDSTCEVISIDQSQLIIKLQYSDIIIYRQFQLSLAKLTITDSCNKKFSHSIFPFYSNGYGKIEKL